MENVSSQGNDGKGDIKKHVEDVGVQTGRSTQAVSQELVLVCAGTKKPFSLLTLVWCN